MNKKEKNRLPREFNKHIWTLQFHIGEKFKSPLVAKDEKKNQTKNQKIKI